LRNNGLQFSARDPLENARVENGTLVIEGRKERFENPNYRFGAAPTSNRRSGVQFAD
jgi:beta-glucanase (GH16 family)